MKNKNIPDHGLRWSSWIWISCESCGTCIKEEYRLRLEGMCHLRLEYHLRPLHRYSVCADVALASWCYWYLQDVQPCRWLLIVTIQPIKPADVGDYLQDVQPCKPADVHLSHCPFNAMHDVRRPSLPLRQNGRRLASHRQRPTSDIEPSQYHDCPHIIIKKSHLHYRIIRIV